MYSTYNEGKSVVAERFMTLRNKICKHMTAIQKMLILMCQMKYKNIFAKVYTPNWSKEIFVVSKIKNTVPWTYIVNDLNGEEITESFYEKELQKTSQETFRIEKVLKRKCDKLYVKWEEYDNRFNSQIDRKDLQ